jgi:betaine-aldehyde dehydrogenase
MAQAWLLNGRYLVVTCPCLQLQRVPGRDARKVCRFYEQVRAGTIGINDPLTDNYAGPFGGMQMSGLGRELGEEGLEEFWQTKHVHWEVEGGIKEFWYPY